MTIGQPDRQTTLWRLSRNGGARKVRQIAVGRGSNSAVDFALDSSFLYSAGGSDLRRWDLAGERGFLRRLPFGPRSLYSPFAMVAPGGGRASFLTGGGFSLRDFDGGRDTRLLPFGKGYRHTAGAWHPDGQHYATANGAHVKEWDMDAERLIRTVRYPESKITELDYSPDGSRLVVAGLSGVVRVLDARTLTEMRPATDFGQPVRFVAVGPDGRTAVVLLDEPGTAPSTTSTAHAGWAQIDLETGTVIARGRSGLRSAAWLGYTPDGRYAAISGGDSLEYFTATASRGQLVVIDLETAEPVRPPVTAHEGVAFQLGISPDSARIVTSGLDGTVALWDTASGTLIARVVVPDRPNVGAEFLPDGNVRIVNWWSGTAWTWDVGVEHAIETACAVAGRNLTESEWRTQFGDRSYASQCDV